MPTPLSVPGLPFSALPSDEGTWSIDGHRIVVIAKPHSDLFIDPSGTPGGAAGTSLNATTLLGDPPPGDFVFSARVRADFEGTFDAGVLMVWIDDDHWAKLCFEQSPAGRAMVVSVVTRGVSDDANSFVVDGDHVWLRIARIGRAFAFHASLTGESWEFVRVFALGETGAAKVGFEGQSPMGDGCRVEFDDVFFDTRTLADLRDGS
jgi:regulation of enolase protein 1 (concanavalin A-like superfamily)